MRTEHDYWSEHPSSSLLHLETFFPLWLIFLKDCWLWKKRLYLSIYSNLEINFLEGFEVNSVISKEIINPFLSEYLFSLLSDQKH